MTDTTLNTTNPTPVDSATTLNGVIAAANGGATSEAVFGANIVDASPTTITGADLSIDGAGFTLTGSSTSPGLVVASNAEVFVGDLNINDGGDGSISVGVGGQVNFIGSSAPTGSTLGVIGGAISGAGAVVVGTSTDTTAALPLVFDAANTYTGATDIYQTLDLVSAGSIADSASVTLGAVGVLDISNAQTAGGAAVTEIVNNLSGAAGSIYLGLNTLEIVDSSSTTFSGVIANNAGGYGTSGQVQISAAGETLTLTGDDTYTGGTKILSGTLALTGTASIADSANVSLKATGATLDVSGETGPTVSINELTGVAGSKVVLGANTLDVTENVVSASFSGVISGSGGLTLSGPDELSLAGANTYMGATVIESGATLGVSGAGSLATSGISGAGAFDISAATAAVTVADLTTTGAVTLGAERLIVEGTSTSSGVISGSGSLQVGTASVTGSETLSGTDTYTGATVIYGALTLDGSIAHSSNVSLKMSGASLTIDSYQSIHELTGVAGTSVVNNDGLVVTESVTNASFSGVISGSGNLEVAAAASGTTYTLTLAGANTYTGGTNIDQGATLALSGAGSVGTGNVTDNGVLDISGASNAGSPVEVTLDNFGGSGSLVLGANFADIIVPAFNEGTFSGVISGSGGIEVSISEYPGGIDLTGANTYTGVTQIDSGADLTLGAALASSGITDNGSLDLGDGNESAVAVSQVVSGSGDLYVENGFDGIDGNSPPFTATLTAANTYTGYTELYEYNTLVLSGGGSISDSDYVYNYGGTIDISGASAPIVLNNYYDEGYPSARIVLGANTVIFEGTGDGDLYGTVISGTGAVQIGTSSVAADVYIETAQTYTGATKVYGYLELSDAGSVASSSNVSLKASGAVFDVSGVTETMTAPAVAINTLTGVAGSEVYLGSNTLDVTQNIAATFSGTIEGSGSLIVDGTATLTLAGADNADYGWSTTIDPGASLALSGAGTLGTGDVTDNGVLSISAATVTLDDFSGTGSLVLGANTTTTLDESNDTFSGVISGSGGIVVEGDLTLTSASTYTGATVIDGELTLGASLASSGITDNGGLNLGDGNESAITVSQVISGDGYVEAYTGSDGLNGDSPAFTATLTAANTYTGETYIGEYNTLALSGAGSIADSDYVYNYGGTIDISEANAPVVLNNYYDDEYATAQIHLGANTVIFEGTDYGYLYSTVISGTGGVQIGTSSVAGEAYIYAAQTYTGATTIYGYLQLDDAGSIASSSNVSLKASGAEFDISDITSFSGTPTADINTLTGVAGTYVDLGSNNLDVTQNIAATFSGTIEGSGSLIVDGAATLTLAGTNTYSGATTIDAGASLALSGTGTLGTGAVTDNGVLDISAATPPGALVPGSHATVTLNEFSGTGSLVLGSNAVVFSGSADGPFMGAPISAAGTFSGVISGAGSVEVSGNIYLSGANTYTGSTTIDSGDFLVLDGSLATSNIVNNGHLVFGDGYDSSITISQVISGTGNLDLLFGGDGLPGDSPAFTATLTGAETYTGDTNVYQYNTLVLSGAGSIGDSSNVNNYGGTIDISGASAPVVLNDYYDAGDSTASIVLGSNTVIFESGYADIYGGVVSGSGGVQVGTSSMATYVEFDNAQAYTGATKVYGDLVIYDANAVASSSNVSLKAAGATFDISGVSGTAHINTLTGVAMTTVDLGSNTLDVTQNTAASFSGVIEGSGNLIVDAAGAATLTLLGVNTLTGSVTDNGALTLGVANAIMDSSLVVDGTLNLGANQSVLSLTGSSAGTVNLGAYALTDAIASATQHDTLAGLITGSGSLVETGSFGGSASAPTAASNLTSSFLTLSHAGSTFTGGVTIEGGTVEVAALGAAGTGAVTFADVSTTTAADAGILQIDNAALTGAGTASESFSNTISGVSAQDIIDLSGLTFSTAPGGSGSSVAFHNGELLVTEGNVTVALTIAGLTASQAAEYHVYEDAHGGTFVTQVAPADATHFHP